MSETFTADQVRDMLRLRCAEGGGVLAWSAAHGVTPSHVYSILADHHAHPIGNKISRALGLKRKQVRTSVFTLDGDGNAA